MDSKYKSMNFGEKLNYSRELLLDAIVSELEDGDTTNVGTLNQLLNSNKVTEDKKTDEGMHQLVKKRLAK